MSNIKTKTKKMRNGEETNRNVSSSIEGREVEEGQKFQYWSLVWLFHLHFYHLQWRLVLLAQWISLCDFVSVFAVCFENLSPNGLVTDRYFRFQLIWDCRYKYISILIKFRWPTIKIKDSILVNLQWKTSPKSSVNRPFE